MMNDDNGHGRVDEYQLVRSWGYIKYTWLDDAVLYRMF